MRIRIACWLTKATDTLRICNIYCFSMAVVVAQGVLHLYIFCLSCYTFQVGSWEKLRIKVQIHVSEQNNVAFSLT